MSAEEIAAEEAQPMTAVDAEDNQERNTEASPEEGDLDAQPSAELKELLEQHQQLQSYARQINRKIFDLETLYLDECSFGNVVKGWDLDGRFGPYRARTFIDDKDRLFSLSSHSLWEERKSFQEAMGDKGTSNALSRTVSQQKNTTGRKYKKRKTNDGDFLYLGDAAA